MGSVKEFMQSFALNGAHSVGLCEIDTVASVHGYSGPWKYAVGSGAAEVLRVKGMYDLLASECSVYRLELERGLLAYSAWKQGSAV